MWKHLLLCNTFNAFISIMMCIEIDKNNEQRIAERQFFQQKLEKQFDQYNQYNQIIDELRNMIDELRK